MQNLRLSLSLPVFVAGSALASLLCLQGQNGPAAPPRIAAVDPHRAVTQDPQAQADMKSLQQKVDAFNRELEEAKGRVKELEAVRDVLARESEEHLRAQIDVVAAKEKVKAMAEGLDMVLEAENRRLSLEAFERVNKVVAELAQQRGLTVVLRAFAPAEPTFAARVEFAQRVNVLWYDPALDLTEDVIKLLKSKSKSQ
jgi:Skp family chaperone for outer membrane proteins